MTSLFMGTHKTTLIEFYKCGEIATIWPRLYVNCVFHKFSINCSLSSSSFVRSQALIDLFRPRLIVSSRVFQLVFVYLVYTSALRLKSCCCTISLNSIYRKMRRSNFTHNCTYNYYFFILCIDFMMPSCRPSFAEVACTTQKLEQSRLKLCNYAMLSCIQVHPQVKAFSVCDLRTHHVVVERESP